MLEDDGELSGADGQDVRAKFDALLGSRGWILADGATGTNLFALGMGAGDSPELLNVQQPELVQAVYRNAISVGADLILTNSFGGNRARLKLHDAAGRTRELCQISAQLAHETASEFGNGTIVAGSMGPTGELMAPMGVLTPDVAVDIFLEQAEGLKAGGADVAWIETISDISELDCAAQACFRAGLPYCATLSFDTAGRTMMGVAAGDLANWAAGATWPPLAIGANCGAGAADLIRTILEFPKLKIGMHLIAKANAGIPKWEKGAIHYDGSPDLMADYAELALRSGAKIIGGCCGTTFRHIQEMRARLETFKGGGTPMPEEIVGKLGQFSADIGPDPKDRNRRQRRRRP